MAHSLGSGRISAVLPQRAFTRFPLEETAQTISERFEQQVRRCPERLAVKTRQHALSYAQLNALGNRVALAITTAAPAHPSPVAIILEQGALLVGAIIGVLKADRPYVGLDPTHSTESLRRTLDHCGANVILTNQRNRHLATGLVTTDQAVIDLDSLDSPTAPNNPNRRGSPDDPAYIYYTSGSTGVPKGVVDAHRNVLHNVMRYTNNLQINESDRLTLLQSVAFSGAVSSLFCALLNGATCYPMDLREEGIEGIGAWLVDEQITLYHSVPSIFQRLLATGRTFPSLRVIRLEGDQVTGTHVDLFKAHFGPDVTLVNGLGATETGISHQYPIRRDTVIAGTVVPVGYATADMQGLIVDAAGTILPFGTVGEIAIKSQFLATGYWRQPELTAARFLPDPTGGPERIYRTGDLGRSGPDGCLEYLGRSDHLLKLHGRWVNVQAIELALTRLGSISEAVVLIRDTPRGEPELVAYIVPAPTATPTVSDLRRALAAAPGEITVPSRFVPLKELPLDANGKVNRKALPAPDSVQPDRTNPPVPPNTAVEQKLMEIWMQVLALGPIGIHDNFSELGGDSLQAIEIAVQIQKHFGHKLPASALLASPTIAELARQLNLPEANRGHLVAIKPTGSRRPFFCMHDGYGDVVAYGALAQLLDPDQPVFGLRARGLDSRDMPLDRVEDMAALYLAEIRKMQPRGPYSLGGNCFGGVVAFEVAQQMRAAGDEVSLLALFDTAFPTGWIRNRTQWHFHRLARKSVGGIIVSLAQLLGRAVRRTMLRLRPGQSTLRLQSAAQSARPSQQILFANNRASSRYRPKPYAAPVIQFCVGEPHNHLGWRKVIGPGLRFVKLPSTESDDDGHIVQHPHVTNLATALDPFLRATESKPNNPSS